MHPPRAWEYLAFQWKGKHCTSRVTLPFDIKLAPFVFSKITTAIASFLRSWLIKLEVYLDDFLFGD
jgi:hypothetical protein